jgi:superfamily I DNA and/or RNA helicase
MHREIGGLIADCFYPEGLEHGVDDLERQLGLLLLGSPLRWLDTSEAEAREQPIGTSYRNPAEAALIMQRLAKMDRAAKRQNLPVPPSVGVLTAYLPQEELLRSRLRSKGERRFTGIDVSVLTVDAAQGKEFDIVLYSAVRSNPSGNIGFLRDKRRLNVALSRARDGLLIVGDARSLSRAGGSNPFIAVKAYFEQRPETRIWERAVNA